MSPKKLGSEVDARSMLWQKKLPLTTRTNSMDIFCESTNRSILSFHNLPKLLMQPRYGSILSFHNLPKLLMQPRSLSKSIGFPGFPPDLFRYPFFSLSVLFRSFHAHKMSFHATKMARMSVLFFRFLFIIICTFSAIVKKSVQRPAIQLLDVFQQMDAENSGYRGVLLKVLGETDVVLEAWIPSY